MSVNGSIERTTSNNAGITDDVMAHVHTFGIVAPAAAPIIQ